MSARLCYIPGSKCLLNTNVTKKKTVDRSLAVCCSMHYKQTKIMSRKIKILNHLNVFECEQRNVQWSHGQREGEIKRQSSFGYSNYSTEFIGTWRTQWVWLSHALSTLLYITLTRRIPSLTLSSPSFTPPPFIPFQQTVQVCVYLCVDVFPSEKQTEYDSQRINKVLMSVWALSRRSC